ncbi:MAG: SDR family NAD(P)-dependent oxidoreductase [Sphingomonadaceae bacterium]
MTPEFGSPATAIVTGGARRLGAAMARALCEDGWHVLIHCHRSREEAGALAGELGEASVVAADLAGADAAETVMAALDGLPPPRLLVNNASRYVGDDIDSFTVEDWDLHHRVNARAPVLLARAFAKALAGANGLIVNITDAGLAAPDAGYFSYTASKMAFAGAAELLARYLAARKVRVCAIAPAMTLIDETPGAAFRRNPLGREIVPAHLVAALRFIVATPTLAGETIAVDAGRRLLDGESGKGGQA